MVTDLSLFSVLKATMRWQQARQSVLAENVANVDSNNYQARDLKPLSFGGMVGKPGVAAGEIATTQAGHIGSSGQGGKFAKVRVAGSEVTPDGNQVTLEDQMMKLTENELNYQAATTLYARALSLVKTALSRGT